MSGNKESRRSVLQAIGAGAAGITTLGTMSVPSRAGNNQIEINEVTGHRKSSLIGAAEKTDGFRKLKQRLLKAYQLRPDLSDITVLELPDPDGVLHQIVSIPFEETGKKADSVSKEGDVAVIFEEEEVLRATGSVLHYEDSVPVSATSIKATDDGLKTDTAEINVDVPLEGGLDSVSIQADDNTVTVTEGGDVHADASLQCWACKLIGDAICAAGCSVGMSAICGSLSIVGWVISGAVCTAIGGAFCTILLATSERYVGASCAGDIGIEWTCHYAGYCSEPSSYP